EDKTMSSQITEVRDALDQQLRDILQKKVTNADSRITRIIKTFYANCMDTDRIEERGIAPLHKILAELGGWPVVEGDDWDPTGFDWMKSILKNKELGYSEDVLFEITVFPDLKNSTWNIIRMSQPKLPISRDAFIKGFHSNEIQAYYKYQVGLAELLGADLRVAAQEMKDNVEFEAQIAKITLPRSQSRNYVKLYNKISIKQLEKLTPGI
ncbi:unnamed protein product, partial [Meganyctiphanes norvegica]